MTSGLPLQHFKDEYRNKILSGMTMFNNSPAIISWGEARKYCQWLKKQTNINFTIPTEAQ